MSNDARATLARTRFALFPAILLSLALAGCGAGGNPTVEATIGPALTAESELDETDDHGAEEPLLSPGADPGEPNTGQTDTDWGPIWDRLPDDFPVHPDAEPTDPVALDEPVSAAYTIGGDPSEIAAWMQAALEDATYSTEALSGPLDDGSYVIDSVGDGECRMEVMIAPSGRTTLLTVRYGVDCPNE